MSKKIPSFVELVVIIYVAFQSRSLLFAWTTSFFDQFGWLALLIWTFPVVVYYFSEKKKPSTTPSLMALGLFFSLLGTLGSLNFLHHVGLACAIAGLLPSCWMNILWIACAISWMPALGWVATRVFPTHVLTVRILLAGMGTLYMILLSYWPKQEFNHER